MKHLILIFLLSLILSSCIKKECQIVGAYEFEIPVTLSPPKDTFNIGDTITISSIFADEVYERKTDKWYKLENFRFFPGTEVKKIDETSVIEGLTSFEIIIDSTMNYNKENYSGGKLGLGGEYIYGNNLQFSF